MITCIKVLSAPYLALNIQILEVGDSFTLWKTTEVDAGVHYSHSPPGPSNYSPAAGSVGYGWLTAESSPGPALSHRAAPGAASIQWLIKGG